MAAKVPGRGKESGGLFDALGSCAWQREGAWFLIKRRLALSDGLLANGRPVRHANRHIGKYLADCNRGPSNRDMLLSEANLAAVRHLANRATWWADKQATIHSGRHAPDCPSMRPDGQWLKRLKGQPCKQANGHQVRRSAECPAKWPSRRCAAARHSSNSSMKMNIWASPPQPQAHPV